MELAKHIFIYFVVYYFEQRQQEQRHPLQFVTLTFQDKGKSLEEYIELMKKFIKSTKTKQSYEYFWVQERGDHNNIHFHMICNWNYSYNWITEKWNRTIGQENVHAPSVKCKPIDDIEGLLIYLSKEAFKNIGISQGVNTYIKSSVHKLFHIDASELYDLTYNDFKKHIDEASTRIIGVEAIQMRIEEVMFEKFYKPRVDKKTKELKSRNIYDWLKHLNKTPTMRKNKEEFIEQLNRYLNNKSVKQITKLYLLNIKQQRPGLKMLWDSLLMTFLLLTKSGSRKIPSQDLVEKVENVLINLINWRIDKKNDNQLRNQVKPIDLKEIALKLIQFIQYYSKDFIEMKVIVEEGYDTDRKVESSDAYYLINRKIKFEKIEIDELDKVIKFYNPMVIEPKDWLLKKRWNKKINYNNYNEIYFKLNPDFTPYTYGGFLNNGKRFYNYLSKLNSSNEFRFLNQESVSAVNFLQKQKLKINSNLYKFVLDNLSLIKKELFKIDTTIEDKEKELEQINRDIRTSINCKDWTRFGALKELKSEIKGNLVKYEVFNEILILTKLYNDFEYFYEVYNVDFRGRLYPVSEYLNHQGNPLAKHLIYFYEDSPLDLYWFKVYCVRLWGKVLPYESADEMIRYFDDTLCHEMEQFRTNNCWLKADEQIAFLNCCLEYERYLIFGKYYTTGMPIYFDATCSVMQIISLLFRLEDYATDLNIVKKTSSDEIGDFYMANIAEYQTNINNIIEKLKLEVKPFNFTMENYTAIEEILTRNNVWRKLFKHILMTKEYGLTYYGIYSKLKDGNYKYKLNLNEEQREFLLKTIWYYLINNKIFKNLDLISEIVKEVTDLNKDIVFYTNENGFASAKKDAKWLVKQRYNVMLTKTITFDGSKSKNISKRKVTFKYPDKEKIDKSKQVMAFKANLIHHLDSLWIHNLVNVLGKQNINVLTIHDCFGVQMKNIETLNKEARSVLTNIFNNRENLLNLLLQLEKAKNTKLQKKTLEEYKGKSADLIGNLQINLDNAFYLIFPG